MKIASLTLTILKKIVIIFLCLGVLVLYSFLTVYYYDVDKAAEYVTMNAEGKSVGLCARYVRLAIEAGGCPTYLHPEAADGYDVFLAKLGFDEVEKAGYTPLRGDIVVIKATGSHINGHIAMYNGKRWVSDFAQRDMFGSSYYRRKGTEYHIFRRGTGWGKRRLF